MMAAKKSVVAVVMLSLAVSPVLAEETDEEGIRQAVLNYAGSVYDVQPELVDASVHPRLQKFGYASRDGVNFRELWMTFDGLRELAASWNEDGEVDAATARRDVTVLDRMGRIAVARLDAEWGVDYFHLAKLDGTWKIMNVIWTTYPPAESAGEPGGAGEEGR